MKKLLSLLFVVFSTGLVLVACQPKDDGNKDQEITYARQSYDRCAQTRGQDACNTVRGGTVMSIREYYGNANSTMGMGYGYMNPGLMIGGMQYNATQINAYFDNYLRRASKDEIVQMATQWTNSFGSFNGFYNQPMNINTTRCTAYGC